MEVLLNLLLFIDYLSSLRFFYDLIEIYIRGFEILGKKIEIYGDIFVFII